MVKNWSLRLVLGVFCLNGYTRLGSAQPLPASPPAPLQGERGVICFAYCTLVTGWLVIHQTHPQPSSASPTATTSLTPNPSPRGEGSDMRCLLHACYLSTRQLPNRSSTSQSPRLLVNLASHQLPLCPLFSNNFNTKSAIFIHQLLT